MKTISLEYCHVTPDTSWEEEVEAANLNTPRLLDMHKGQEIQKCIMIDDLHSKVPITPEFIQSIVDLLVVKPDCIYLESSFTLIASDIAAKIDPAVAELAAPEGERVWLKKVHDQYNSVNDFLLSWRKTDGTIVFSCPTLVAASYLFRLGLIEADIKPVWGEEIKKTDILLSSLSSKYLQVESNAQLIMKATYPQAEDRIEWHFY